MSNSLSSLSHLSLVNKVSNELLNHLDISEDAAVKKAGGKYKISPIFKDTMTKMQQMLENSIPIRNGTWNTSEIDLINEKTRLITTEPMIYLLNMSKSDYIRKKNKWLKKIADYLKDQGKLMVIF